MIKLIKGDCNLVMQNYPDNYFDLAVVDPPYGIKEDGHRENNRSKLSITKKYHSALWDQDRPSKDYFLELVRISKHQIIFGANHLCDLFEAKSSSWIVWDKCNGSTSFADCELAYTSFETAVRKFSFMWNGMQQGKSIKEGHLQQGKKILNEIRIHPTHKPVALYKWIFKNYAKPDFKILDTHLGGASSAIAYSDFGTSEFVGIEIDKTYFNDAKKRVEIHLSQTNLLSETHSLVVV